MSKVIIMLGAGLILLPGCKPAANDATALLKAGDARICVAPEVEDTLREMIAPKPDLAKAYSVTFSDATLESYDPQVHKALCNTRVTVQGPGGGLIDHAPAQHLRLALGEGRRPVSRHRPRHRRLSSAVGRR